MRHNKSKNAVVLGVVFGAGMLATAHSAMAQKIELGPQFNVGVKVKIEAELLQSDVFGALLEVDVKPVAKTAAGEPGVELDSIRTASLPFARITHDFVPLPQQYYSNKARIGPKRPIKSDDLDVRVVYANPITLRDTIPFER